MTDGAQAAAVAAPARMPGSFPAYLTALLGALGLALGSVLCFNLALGQRSLGSTALAQAASDWQQARRGVTYAPPITAVRPFKILRLHDRLPHLDAMVFGASSVLGVTDGMFPAGITAYNFSTNGNSLLSSLGEAEYVRANFERIRWFVLTFDWAAGFLFEPGVPVRMDLSRAAAAAALDERSVPWHRLAADALTYPRIANLGAILLGIARAPEPWRAFRQLFFEAASDEYACPDGTPAKDFDVLYRGRCGGFYYDGSSGFYAWKQIRPQELRQRVLVAAAPSSKYSQALTATGGEPNRAFLETAARLHRELERAGGGVIVLLPPLIPGLEELLAASPHGAAPLRRLKEALAAWAERERLPLLDAGRSEGFGCEASEFLDEHHALRECYRKIFDRYWRERGRNPARPPS